jgi:hypothetical protein
MWRYEYSIYVAKDTLNNFVLMAKAEMRSKLCEYLSKIHWSILITLGYFQFIALTIIFLTNLVSFLSGMIINFSNSCKD